MEFNELLPDILRYLKNAGYEHDNIKKVDVLFPYLYWDLDRKTYYTQHDVVFESDLDSFITKLKDSEIKKHDFEDCFGTPFELHQDPLLVKLHTDSEYIVERLYYIFD